MSSIVLDLQRDALDPKVRVSDLLRKALLVARKLSLQDFEGWISRELNGYGPGDEIPEYRRVHGEIRSLNPFRGWIPVTFEDPELAASLSERGCRSSIAELEHLCSGSSSGIKMPFSTELQHRLDPEAETATIVSRSSLVGILDTVRTTVLDWALRLEKEGVLGEGLTFTPEEKRAAESVNHFYGPVQIQQGSPHSVQIASAVLDPAHVRSFLEALRGRIDQLDLSAARRQEVEAEVRTLDAQIASPNPKPTIVREGLRSIRTILEETAGAVAGQLLAKLSGLAP